MYLPAGTGIDMPAQPCLSIMDHALTAALEDAISAFTGKRSTLSRATPVGGGSISHSIAIEAGSARWFVKLNNAEQHELFAAEADGLRALARCPAVRVPQVVGDDIAGNRAYLILEYLPLAPLGDDTAAENAGRALAKLHRMRTERFGWHRDNFIGATRQENTAEQGWPRFFAQQRLKPQLELARRNGGSDRLFRAGNRLLDAVSAFFADHHTEPSLLHGDLWQGNAALVGGQLALFDPAVYFGDREADLAMTELFGGFPHRFYAAYREAWPLAAGYAQRRTLYNLYHVLNHFNLFGGGYLRQAEGMIDALLAEIT